MLLAVYELCLRSRPSGNVKMRSCTIHFKSLNSLYDSFGRGRLKAISCFSFYDASAIAPIWLAMIGVCIIMPSIIVSGVPPS